MAAGGVEMKRIIEIQTGDVGTCFYKVPECGEQCKYFDNDCDGLRCALFRQRLVRDVYSSGVERCHMCLASGSVAVL